MTVDRPGCIRVFKAVEAIETKAYTKGLKREVGLLNFSCILVEF
ncbi:MAG: hypothetical protein SFZ03_01870 [Candidatus Melainabacteria bacterium]|nr:hypothetical protein [Candidatus Melainabacteria bacterium]